jgi:hypothetical protein
MLLHHGSCEGAGHRGSRQDWAPVVRAVGLDPAGLVREGGRQSSAPSTRARLRSETHAHRGVCLVAYGLPAWSTRTCPADQAVSDPRRFCEPGRRLCLPSRPYAAKQSEDDNHDHHSDHRPEQGGGVLSADYEVAERSAEQNREGPHQVVPECALHNGRQAAPTTSHQRRSVDGFEHSINEWRWVAEAC